MKDILITYPNGVSIKASDNEDPQREYFGSLQLLDFSDFLKIYLIRHIPYIQCKDEYLSGTPENPGDSEKVIIFNGRTVWREGDITATIDGVTYLCYEDSEEEEEKEPATQRTLAEKLISILYQVRQRNITPEKGAQTIVDTLINEGAKIAN